MDKFIDISEQELIVSGTSVTPVGSADLTDTGDVFANVSFIRLHLVSLCWFHLQT